MSEKYTGDHVQLYEKDGMVAVLTSDDYGSGWSTWNDINLAFDKRVVEFWLQCHEFPDLMKVISSPEYSKYKREAEKLFESWGYNNVCFSAFEHLGLRWIRKGEPFIIREYDGKEWTEFRDNTDWISF